MILPCLVDEDGLTDFSYQWYADGLPITGATAPTYAVPSNTMGKAHSVTVSYIDGHGSLESISSMTKNLNMPTITALTANPTMVRVGEPVTLSFNFTNASKCYNEDEQTIIYYDGTLANSSVIDGAFIAYQAGVTDINVTCQNVAGSHTETLTIQINKLTKPENLQEQF